MSNLLTTNKHSVFSLTAITTLMIKYRNILILLYTSCWMLLFFRHSFDFNERFFRIPLALLTLPVLLSLRLQGVFLYLRYAPQAYCVVLMVLAAYIAALACPFPDARSFSHIVFGWFVLSLAGYTMKLALPDKALRLMLFGTISGVLASMLWAFMGLAVGTLSLEDILLAGQRLELFTGYPVTLATITGFALTGLFFFLKHERRLISRKTDVVLAIILFTLLLLTQTRAALGAFGITAAAIMIAGSKKPLQTVALITLCGIILIGTLYGLGQTSFLKTSPTYQRMLSVISHPMEDHSITGRLGIWEVAAESVAERPFTGYGMRMFPNVYKAYMEKSGAELRAKYPFVEPEGGHAHNLFLGALTELGLMGFLSLLCIYLYAFAQRKITIDKDIRCLQAFFLFFFIHGLFDYTLSKIIYSDLFFTTVGLFIGTMFFSWIKKKEIYSISNPGSAVQAG